MQDAQNQIKILVIGSQAFNENCLLSCSLYAKKITSIHTVTSFKDIEKKIADFLPNVILIGFELMDQEELEGFSHCLSFVKIPILLTCKPTPMLYSLLANHTFSFLKKNENTTKEFFYNAIIMHAKALISNNQHSTIIEHHSQKPNYIIAIGASIGGTDAIETVVKDLPATTPGIVIVQHMPAIFTQLYAQRLSKICKMRVKEAADGDIIEKGQILIAAGGEQLEVRCNGNHHYVHCYSGEKVSGHCPSVDVLFHSVAKTVGKQAIGVILTGMGKDGADGLLHMRQKGAFTIGQDEQSCIVYGMPMVAQQIGAIINEVPLSNIAQAILSYLKKMEVILHE